MLDPKFEEEIRRIEDVIQEKCQSGDKHHPFHHFSI